MSGAGIGGGTLDGIEFITLVQVLAFYLLHLQQMHSCAKNRFIKIALECGRAQENNRQVRRADEGTEYPSQLTAKEQVPCEPGEQHPASDRSFPAQVFQELDEPEVRGNSGKGDDRDQRELNQVVSHT